MIAAPTVRIPTELIVPIDAFVTLDFETYYGDDYTLSKMTTEAYVRDERFEVIGVGVKVNDSKTVWMEEKDFRKWARSVNWKRVACLAHHAHFDGLILSHHYDTIPGFWLDTLSMARALHGTVVGNSLAKLLPYYGYGEKGHEVVMAKGKRRRDFTPAEYAAYGGYCINDVDGCKDVFDKMVAAGFPEFELHLIDVTVRCFTEPKFVIDEPLLKDALADEHQRKIELLARVAQDKSVLSSNEKFAALLRSFGIAPPLKVSLPATKTARAKDPNAEPVMGYAFAKTDPGMVDLLEHEDEHIRWLAEARLSVKSTINITRAERFLASGARGRAVPVYLKFAAAHTHRWGGGDKMNFQNLERTNKKDPKKGRLRKALRAPEGYRLVVVDSGQIEARVLGWLAGHETLLETFRRNDAMGVDEHGEPIGDFYSDFGSTVFQKTISKKTHPLERQVAKSMALGLGFGMGWFKFAGELVKGMLGAPSVVFSFSDALKFNVDVEGFAEEHGDRVDGMVTRISGRELMVHCAVTKYLVDLYRERNAPIPALWKTSEKVLAAMTEGFEMPIGPGGVIRTVRHGVVGPNGLAMKYPGLERRTEEGPYGPRSYYSYQGGHGGRERVRAYGGSITENLVQWIARIIVAEQVLPIKARYPIVTMTHDEAVAIAPVQDADAALDLAMTSFKAPPAWCATIPLNASGDVGAAYGDAK